MYRSHSQSTPKVRVSFFFCLATLWLSMCSWVTEAFQFTTYRGVALSGKSIQRSLSGLLTTSSATIHQAIHSSRGAMQMVAIHNDNNNKGFWGIPNWISDALFPNPVASIPKAKRMEIEQRSQNALRRRLADPSNNQAPSSSTSAHYSNTNDIQIPGFMDFDPKSAAKTAHQSKQSKHSSFRAESNWFHL